MIMNFYRQEGQRIKVRNGSVILLSLLVSAVLALLLIFLAPVKGALSSSNTLDLFFGWIVVTVFELFPFFAAAGLVATYETATQENYLRGLEEVPEDIVSMWRRTGQLDRYR